MNQDCDSITNKESLSIQRIYINEIEKLTVSLFYKTVPENVARGGHPGPRGPSSTETNYNIDSGKIDGIVETLKQLQPFV